jgi:hypothetical protein
MVCSTGARTARFVLAAVRVATAFGAVWRVTGFGAGFASAGRCVAAARVGALRAGGKDLRAAMDWFPHNKWTSFLLWCATRKQQHGDQNKNADARGHRQHNPLSCAATMRSLLRGAIAVSRSVIAFNVCRNDSAEQVILRGKHYKFRGRCDGLQRLQRPIPCPRL